MLFLKQIIYHLINNFGFLFSDKIYTNLLFLFNCIRYKKKYYFLDYKKPKTFNEKVNYIKFFDRNPLAPVVADKIKCRDYICDKIGEEFLVPLYGVYDEPNNINFSKLPKSFVLKLNNGSGFNFICENNLSLNIKAIKRKINNSMKKNIYALSREWHYKKIKSKILIEKKLGDNINDYKFYCNNSNGPFLIHVDSDRFISHKRDFFDLKWNKLDINYIYPNSSNVINKPNNLNLMLKLAKQISKDFIFSRVDFYEIENKVYFGEITIHPEGGVGPFDNYAIDLNIGKMINLNS